MLTITIPAEDYFDDEKGKFIVYKEVSLSLEHSLFSLSKWESEWEKPFLGPVEKTTEEVMSYIKAMTLTPNIPAEVYNRLTNDNFEQVNTYIKAKMSATWFNERDAKKSRDIITSEVIYSWMVGLQIPFECQHWHLNRLFSLIKVCNSKHEKPKNMSRAEMLAQRNALNAKRKAEMNTSG